MSKAKRKRISDELAALEKRGRLSAKRVVEWAKSHRESALHRCFQWNDSKAAQQWRLWQARQLIVSVEVKYEDGKKHQVYVSPVAIRKDNAGYARLSTILSNAQLRMQYLDQALAELERICARYNDLAELSGIRTEIQLVRKARESALKAAQNA